MMIQNEREYAVTEVAVFLSDRLKVLPAFSEHPVVAFKTPTALKVSRRIQQLRCHLTVGGSEIEERFDLAPVAGVYDPLGDLHVRR